MAHFVDVPGDADHREYSLGTVEITDGTFELFAQDADRLSGTYPIFGWAWLDLTPSGTPPAPMHYITDRHESGETISTGSMTMAGLDLPAAATALAMSGSQPFIAVTDHGAGRAVQWGSYDWMLHSVKGPVYGLDDLVWRSIVWAARKPFVMQGLPPFVTMRVDDESGPFDWIHTANEYGLLPWAGLFYQNVDATEAADLSALVNAGLATASVHAKNGAFFYYDHGVGDFDQATVDANFAEATAFHTTYNIPISKYVLPHYYEFGTNVFEGLDTWGVEFVGTHMDPGDGYGSPWVANGPYRLYETGSSSATRPVYYADYLDAPGYPDTFFNCVTEIRDDAGYEWYPDNDVAATVGKGTRQTERALDSMALATLFTHGYFLPSISDANWHAILQGITENLAPYNPIYVTMDHACQYVRAVHTSNIAGSIYDPTTRELTTSLVGSTDMPTVFYLFMDQGTDIQGILVDVPTFTGSTDVVYTLPGALASIVVTPDPATLVTGETQQFTATGYDADSNPIPNLAVTWDVVNGGGTITQGGLFSAGATPGTYAGTVRASFGGFEGTATVEVVAPALDHFTFDQIASPQSVDVPFEITVQARDQTGELLTDYIGQADLSDSTGTLTPAQTGSFVAGVWTGDVTVGAIQAGVTILAADGAAEGTSGVFNVQAEPTFYTLTSTSYQQTTGTAFDIAVEAYSGTTIDLWEDVHQDPVLATTTDSGDLDPIDGEWTEYLHTDRGFPSILAHVDEETHGLPVMHFSSTGIPNGTYDVVANLYDNASLRYFYGFDAVDPKALSVDTAGSAPGTQHREYSLGTVSITNNAFHLYVQDADLLDGSYAYFGWAHVTLEPVEEDYVFIDCSDNGHQDPVLTTTTDPGALAAEGLWTELLYTPLRDYPSILAHVDEVGAGLPVMHFSSTGIPNGTYELIANLYDNAAMRYYYGFEPSTPTSHSVDLSGGATGEQHTEVSLGTVEVTDGTFNLYVQDADLITGTGYEYFGWAWLKLRQNFVTMSSSSATMQFDGNGNGTYGETGDEIVILSDEQDGAATGSATVSALDTTAASDVVVTAADAQGRFGTTPYDIGNPTAVRLVEFGGRSALAGFFWRVAEWLRALLSPTGARW